jgi:peptide/nickel transport system substrate-binding protein
MTHFAALVAAVVALAVAVLGPTPPAAIDAAGTAAEAELVVAMPDDTNNMDPRIGMGSIRSTYIRQVFESLVDVDAQGKPVPGLALAWKPIGDTTWEFTLRRGVTFHDGEAFNADTVLFNLDRMFRKNLDKHGIKDVAAGTQFDKTLPYVSRWEKVDDYTVRVHTSEPAPTLWDALGREPLVPKAWTIKHGVDALNERPVGTGAWKLVEWRRKTSMVLERNDAYWAGVPAVKRLRLQVIPEASARLAALRAGQVSLVDAVPPVDAAVLARDPNLKIVSGPQKLNCRLYLNGRLKNQFDSGGKDGLYGDARTRLALAHAVNREAVIRKIFQGYALANTSPVSTVSYGYAAQEPYAYDPKRARTLLSEAGWKDTGRGWERNGEPLVLNLHYAAKHYGQAFDETTAAVAEMLKDVGVQVTLKAMDFGTVLQMTQKGTLPYNGGFAACRTSNNLDADDFLRDWTAFTLINWTPYPPELMAAYTTQRRELDPAKRLRLLADLQRQVRDWAPVVPLYQEVKVYAHSARVTGFTPLTELHMDFRGVALRK